MNRPISEFKCYIDRSTIPHILRDFKSKKQVIISQKSKLDEHKLKSLIAAASEFNMDSFEPDCEDYILVAGNIFKETLAWIIIDDNPNQSYFFG